MSVSTLPAETSFLDRCAANAHDAVALLGRLAMSWIFLSSGFTKRLGIRYQVSKMTRDQVSGCLPDA